MGKGHLWEEHAALTARGRGSLMVGAWMRRNCQQRSCKTQYHNWAVPFLHRLLCLDTLGMGGVAGRWPQPRNPQIPPKVKTQLHNKERHLKEPRVNLTYCLRDHKAGEREKENKVFGKRTVSSCSMNAGFMISSNIQGMSGVQQTAGPLPDLRREGEDRGRSHRTTEQKPLNYEPRRYQWAHPGF